MLKLSIVPCAEERIATTAEDAAVAADRLGYPVVLKIHAEGLAHKTEIGGVALNLPDAAAVRQSFADMMRRVREKKPELKPEGAIVQPMAKKGVEIVIGVTRDEIFGPTLMVGLGGIHVEILRDVAFSPVPLTAADAARLLRQLRAYRLLEGVRGEPPADVATLCELIATVSRFAADFAAEVAEIDINPVIVHGEGQGLTVADALIVKTV